MNSNLKKIYTSLSGLFVLFILAAMPVTSYAETPEMKPQIVITGKGEVRVPTDTAVVQIGKITQAKSAGVALKENNKAMNEVVESLKAAGIEPKNLQTSNFSIQPQYQYDNKNAVPPKLIGYQVSNQLTVRIENLDKAGELLDKVVELGANNIQGIYFTQSDQTVSMNEARRAAIVDAKAKASLYADALGVKLGKVISINEHQMGIPAPMMYERSSVQMKAADASVPIEAGSQMLTVMVNIIWSIE